jgi:hypothetical protein
VTSKGQITELFGPEDPVARLTCIEAPAVAVHPPGPRPPRSDFVDGGVVALPVHRDVAERRRVGFRGELVGAAGVGADVDGVQVLPDVGVVLQVPRVDVVLQGRGVLEGRLLFAPEVDGVPVDVVRWHFDARLESRMRLTSGSRDRLAGLPLRDVTAVLIAGNVHRVRAYLGICT